MAGEETELKLSATPRTLARLAADPLLGGPRGAPQTLVAIYFDTPRHALWRHGITLRLRKERGRWVQTVKARGALEAGLHRRLEHTQRASSAMPDLALIRDSDLAKQVAQAIRGVPLVSIFRVEVTRETRLVSPEPGVTIEVSFDRGTILAGKSRAPVCELEFELKQGPAWRLFELALAVAARHAVRLEHRSKAERGYELAGAVQAAPVHARLGVIGRGMSASAAFKAVCLTCLNHLQANQRGAMRGTDPEYLHQARVALRRLQSGLGAFKSLAPGGMIEPHAQSVRDFIHALGPARDWDVFVEETLAPVLQQFPGHAGLAAIERACARLRGEAKRSARRLFASRRTQRLLLGLGGWLAQEPWLAAEADEMGAAWRADVREHATQVLDRYERRALKRGGKLDSSSLRRLHRLRIATKKLRYAAGFFSPLFARQRAAAMLEALNELQNVLGEINDRATAPALIQDAMRVARGPLRAQARIIVSHWNSAMLEERRRELARAWKAFQRAERFWR